MTKATTKSIEEIKSSVEKMAKLARVKSGLISTRTSLMDLMELVEAESPDSKEMGDLNEVFGLIKQARAILMEMQL